MATKGGGPAAGIAQSEDPVGVDRARILEVELDVRCGYDQSLGAARSSQRQRMDREAAVGDDHVRVAARSRTGNADVVGVAGHEPGRPVTGRAEIVVDPADPAIGADRRRDAVPVGARECRNSDNQDACDPSRNRSCVESAVAEVSEQDALSFTRPGPTLRLRAENYKVSGPPPSDRRSA